jgi:Zn-dependent protease
MNANNSTDSATNAPRKSNFSLWALIALLLSKGKALAVVFKLKGLITVLSAAVSVLAYWWTGNLGFAGALGLVLLLFVHEMGHVFASKYYGIPVSVPVFIPFLGALITMKRPPKNVKEEAVMALGGPILGSLGALVCLGVFMVNENPLWLWLAYVGFLLNLFNLIPISPLDGGRIAGAIWRGFWFIGLAALVVGAVVTENLFLAFIAMLGLMEINGRYVSIPRWLLYALGVVVLAGVVYLHGWFVLVQIAEAVGLVVLLAVIAIPLMLLGMRIFEHIRAKIAEHEPINKPSAVAVPEAVAAAPEEEEKATTSAETVHQYFSIPLWQRLTIGTVYLTLAAALTYGLIYIHALGVIK